MKESRMNKFFYASPVYAEMMNRLTEMIYVFDEEGRIVFINQAAEKFEELKLEEVKGLYIGDIYNQDYSPSLRALEMGKEVVDTNNVYMVHGKRFHQVARAYPVVYEGKIIGGYTIQTDITSLEKILSENIRLQSNAVANGSEKREFSTLIGNDLNFLRCIEIAKAAAENDSAVLLSGATGSGKEMFAKSIHNASKRRKGPYLAINCAAIPETLLESILFGTVKGSFTGAMDKPGLFEQAKGGTLFLDEINSMNMESQAKILRVLEEKEYRRVGGDKEIATDVRIISSINTTPQEAINAKALREDLFYRLAVVNIMIPPLCRRKEDILLLTEYFIDKYNKKLNKTVKELDSETKEFFLEFSWPGNIRQLKHTVESALSIMAETETVLKMNYLPQYLFENRIVAEPLIIKEEKPEEDRLTEKSIRETIQEQERKQIIDTLYACNGNVAKTARTLNMHRQSLIYKMKRYDIK